jgi:cysteine-rich repeat protein
MRILGRLLDTKAYFIALVCVGALAGCLQQPGVSCDDGTICAVGTTCVAGGGEVRCATDAQMTACFGKAENADCNVESTFGNCRFGVCLPGACGDGVVGGKEECDDGNSVDGDGCSRDCTSNEKCGNGVRDGSKGEECDDGAANSDMPNARCRLNCKLAGCGDNVIDSNTETCDLGVDNSDLPNRACRKNCQPRRCGDQIVDAGEVCDGAAGSPTGKCSNDCLSTVVHGNDYVDASIGEECDEGVPNLGQDGCSSNYKREAGNWQQVTTSSLPARWQHAMAYDRDRHRMVLFGGVGDSGTFGDTWEFDGEDWQRVRSATSPPPRREAVMAYDEARRKIVLYGGRNGGTYFGDTWTWDGTEWQNVTPPPPPPTDPPNPPNPPTSPPGRFGPAMAFDATIGDVVLFGGSDGNNLYADTWLWDGIHWTKVPVSTDNPPGRLWSQMTYDRERERIVMFGGSDGSAVFQDTWERNGIGWEKKNPLASPPATFRHSMSYSDVAQKTLMLGGAAANSGPASSTAWSWNGSSWTQESSSIPAIRQTQTMAYDSLRDRFVVAAGLSNAQFVVSDTWLLNSAGVAAAVSPPAVPQFRNGHSMDYFGNTGELIMFGGGVNGGDEGAVSGPQVSQRTWRLKGDVWRRLETASSPPRRANHASAYDSVRRRLVIFGGADGTQIYKNDIWEFDGVTWTNRTPATGPQPLHTYLATMVFDTVRKKMLLSGGNIEDGGGVIDKHVWEWDGVSGQWTDVTPADADNATRTFGDVVAFDPRRGRAVLFGNNGTWEWTGSRWEKKAPVGAVPVARFQHTMTYDPIRGRVVLFGGIDQFGSLNDVWEWDGNNWKELRFANNPSPRRDTRIAYDAVGARLVMFGGDAGAQLNDTWALQYRSESSPAELCIKGDADTDGDGLKGCVDPDCWGRCTPTCPPYVSCAATEPGCGDGTCNSALETHLLCPADCP